MTTHLRARALQAGALVALVSGMLVVASSPARAEPPSVQITNLSSTNIATGERTTLKYTVANPNDEPGQVRIQVSGMNCSGDCSPVATIEPGGSREFTATLTAPQVDPGDTESIQVQVRATVGGENATDTQTVEVRGPEKPQTVRQISGKVRDLNGKAIAGAQVIMQDSADHKYETTSNNSGAYSFTSSDGKPITPGQVSIGAGKEGFKAAAISVNAAAGKSVSAPSLNLTPTAATPSAVPSATEGASSPPIDEATDDATTDSAGETAGASDLASNEDGGSGSLLFIILGGLLVAAGVGAIVLVLMRRKGNDDDAADKSDGVIPPSPGGRYGDATRVAAPVGARPNDATMVAGMSGPLSISDAPTMLQRPVPADDEFPDPYGAPAQLAHGGYTTAGTYGGAGAQVPVQGGYDDEYAGPATQYGRPVQQQEEYGGFVPPAADQSYDEQTGMYRPEPAYEQPVGYDAGGYRQEPTSAGGYQGGAYGQPQPAGYGPQPQPEPSGGYGSWDAPGGGADNNAYGPASGAGAYGGRAQASGGGAYGGGTPASGAAGSYGAPGGSGTYGIASAGYEVPSQRGGTYGGAPSYGDPGNAGYGGQGGYDPRATYGRPDGYEQPPSRGGQQGGYDSPAGYDQGGYQQGGYDQGGYDQGGYEQQGGGRHGGQPRPEPTPPGRRRPVDWLDD